MSYALYSARPTYGYAGLRWGINAEQARRILRERGYSFRSSNGVPHIACNLQIGDDAFQQLDVSFRIGALIAIDAQITRTGTAPPLLHFYHDTVVVFEEVYGPPADVERTLDDGWIQACWPSDERGTLSVEYCAGKNIRVRLRSGAPAPSLVETIAFGAELMRVFEDVDTRRPTA